MQFNTLVYSPADADHAGLAIAAARADAVGILDLECVSDPNQVERNLEQLLAATAAQADRALIGLRLSANDLELAQRCIAVVGDQPLWLILHGDGDSLLALRTTLAKGLPQGSQIYAEITSTQALAGLPAELDGVIAKGHEAGAWVGDDTSYILAQKLLAATELPVIIRGGVGPHTAAACILNGAAGVVLDDQVLLLTESPLSASLKAELARLNGAETRLFGEQVGQACRVWGARGSSALQEIEQSSRQMEAGKLCQLDWSRQLCALTGWGDDQLRPLGQAVGLASVFAKRHRTLGRLLKAMRQQVQQSQTLLKQQFHLDADSALARSHATRYPIAQGPMTRVSDSPAFANAVASDGGLPFLALALMRGEQVDQMLAETATQLGDKPWGVGLLGFVPQALRQEQCEAVFKHQPKFALIAGGRPDQAAEFESRGIATYLHAPSPALLQLYLEQGAKRFVFEGRECGGHIGPIASFPLWEQMIDILLALPADQAADVHVFFAGGISDERSGALLAALTAPLAAKDIKVGLLMGTAYLFTQEIVETGAIVEGFQREALACDATVSLETGPGHATRCANTAFAKEFFRQRRALLQSDKSAEAIRDELEDLNMGRLRVASKGRDRDADGQLVELDAIDQTQRGMYMIGQVATLQSQVQSIAQLHQRVTVGAGQLLASQAAETESDNPAPSDIAIVGIGMILPQIDDADGFWHKVVNQQTTITEVPKDRWDEALYFDADKNARDKVYAKWGGFLDEIVFDPTDFGIAPNSMKSIDPMQLLSLEATARALRDARMGAEFDNEFDREHTSIILGAGGGIGDLGLQLGLRSELPRFVENPEDEVWDRLPEWTNESFAGVLLNVSAGRVANRMDFGGVNFTVDAACGSSLAAITLATQELESGRSNVAIAGGVDTVQGPFGYLCFSKTQALSPNGKAKTFDRDADGIVISEGVCVTVMKRLADAERDGDRIYAVIKAAAGSSDGRALGMTAPLPKGQRRALDRAYRKAGFSPATLGLVEAHGTGTAVGDQAEAETVTETLRESGAAAHSVALGSVKSLVGHTKCAAGVTGMVKTALSLYHRVLPAHANVEHPIDVLAAKDAPAYLLREPRPWLARADQPRRAAVSAFGFGGTNFHAVLEEYRPAWGADAPAGGQQWPQEVCLFKAADEQALREQLQQWQTRLSQPINPAANLARFAASLAAQTGEGRAVLIVLARDFADLASKLNAALAHLDQGSALASDCYLNLKRPEQAPKLAVLFPGQGAQYVGMGREAALYLPELRQAWEQADSLLQEPLQGSLSAIAWPVSAFDSETEKQQNQRLTDTRHAQPALGALELGLWRFLQALNVSVDAVAGHSYGEYAALMAAGVLGTEDFLRLSAARGAAMAQAAQQADAGGMAALLCSRQRAEEIIAPFDDLAVANHNAPEQTVITGGLESLEQALKACEQAQISARKLPVSGAFHSPLMETARAGLDRAIDQAQMGQPQCVVYSNMSAAPYPAEIAEHLKQHLLSPVAFVDQIERMRADGCELFLELGPRTILSGMLRNILSDGDQRCVAVDARQGQLAGLLAALAQLEVVGISLDWNGLFESRALARLTATELEHYLQQPERSRTAWMVAGGYARPADNPVRSNGLRPALTAEDKRAARARRALQQASPVAAQPVAALAPAQPGLSTPAQPQAAAALSGDAFSAYQETMRQFLQLQETIMAQALGTQAASAPAMAAPSQPLAIPSFTPPAVSVQSPPPEPAANVMQTATAAVSSEPAPVAAGLNIEALVLSIVSERTGYPQDMLDREADLEADLGIDSIKRVEIVGALQKQLPETIAQSIQADVERYTKARHLNELIDRIASLHSDDVSAQSAAPVSVPALDVPSLVLGVVSERTGYPQDMLDREADLEADLGIDSIKRVEIVGALQKQLPSAVAEAMQADVERYTKAQNLQQLITRVEELVGRAAGPSNPSSMSASDGAAPALDVAQLVISTVAERTGYPEDMLDHQANLEADLGIDSIKRVEIVGALQKQLPEDIATAMQADVERFSKADNLQQLIDRVSDLVGTQSAAGSSQAAPSDSAAGLSLDVSSLVLNTVSERTGYPQDMLDRQADLEADLGIDSIKRVEIVGALQKQLPAALAEAMQADMDRYTKARTLATLVERIESIVPDASSVAKAPPSQTQAAPASAVQPDTSEDLAPRHVIRPRQVALAEAKAKLQGLVLLIDGPDTIRDLLARDLTAQGAKPVELVDLEGKALKQALEQAAAEHGPVRALLHLGGLASEQQPGFAAWRKAGTQLVGKLITLIKALGDDNEQLRLICATRLGGTLGREAEGEGHVLSGGVAGVINCYRQEYPQAFARTVDFDGQSDETIAEYLSKELNSQDGLREVGYIGDTRYTVSTEAKALAEHDFAAHLEPQSDWVVLATGGARGITAEILLAMAQPGLRFVLLGRTPLAAEETLYLEHDCAIGVKGALIAEGRVSGHLPKPAEIDRQVAQIMAAREVRDNLSRLQQAGAQVEYRACDVRQPEDFGAQLDEIYQSYGRIDGVIHAAGVIEDKLLVDKSLTSFDRVFGTKTDPAWILANQLRPQGLKWLAFFTSVAGRYGNRGQADYAAGNEALNRLAWQLSRQWSDTRVMAINWGPWDAGMASDAVKEKFRAQGILPIPVKAGADYFLQELIYGRKSEVELVVGAGPWDVYDQVQVDSVSGDVELPLIRSDLRMGAGGSLQLQHHFSEQSDPYLADHRIDGKGVLPAAGAAEWSAQMAAAGWPGWQVAEVRDLKVLAGVVLDAEQGRKIDFKARASSHSQPGEQMLAIDLADGQKKNSVYKASVRLTEHLEEPPVLDLSPLQGQSLAVDKAYADFLFHGECFRLITEISAISSEGVDARVKRSRVEQWLDGATGQWLFDPGLLDCGPQLAILWSRAQLGSTALPSAFGSVCRYGRDPLPDELSVHLRLKGQASAQSLNYDVYFLDAEGRLRLAMRDVEGTSSEALNRLAGQAG